MAISDKPLSKNPFRVNMTGAHCDSGQPAIDNGQFICVEFHRAPTLNSALRPAPVCSVQPTCATAGLRAANRDLHTAGNRGGRVLPAV
jgi:hypothetical protein